MNEGNYMAGTASNRHSSWKFTVILISYVVSATSATVVERCAESFYLSNGTCLSCPDRCTTCISDDRCIQCKPGYYGKACRDACEQCPGQCHKEYGHCTLGCPDGQFPDPNSRSVCSYCKQNCKLCSSLSHCIDCEDGFFDQTCSQSCSVLCNNGRCYQNGECLNCKTGYYKLKDVCLKCPDGCSNCLNAKECLECQDRYTGPFHDTCLEKCQDESQIRHFISCEESRCMSSCDGKCKSEGFCMNGTIATDTHNTKYIKDNMCGIVMYKQCSETCTSCEHEVGGTVCNEKYKCEEMCTFSFQQASDTMSCRHNMSTEFIEEPSLFECVRAPTISEEASTKQLVTVVVVLVILLVMAILIGCLVFCWRRKKVNATNRSGQPETFQTSVTVPVKSQNTQFEPKEFIITCKLRDVP